MLLALDIFKTLGAITLGTIATGVVVSTGLYVYRDKTASSKTKNPVSNNIDLNSDTELTVYVDFNSLLIKSDVEIVPPDYNIGEFFDKNNFGIVGCVTIIDCLDGTLTFNFDGDFNKYDDLIKSFYETYFIVSLTHIYSVLKKAKDMNEFNLIKTIKLDIPMDLFKIISLGKIHGITSSLDYDQDSNPIYLTQDDVCRIVFTKNI